MNINKEKIKEVLFFTFISICLYCVSILLSHKMLYENNMIFCMLFKYIGRLSCWFSLLFLMLAIMVFFEKNKKMITIGFVILTLLLNGYYIRKDIYFVITIPIMLTLLLFGIFLVNKLNIKKIVNLFAIYIIIFFIYFCVALIPYYLYALFSKVFLPFFLAYSKGNEVGNVEVNNYLIGLLSMYLGHIIIYEIIKRVYNFVIKFKFVQKIISNLYIIFNNVKLIEFVFFDFINRIILIGFLMYGMMSEDLTYISTYFVLYSVFTSKSIHIDENNK